MKRADRRPNGYNLAIHTVDNSDDGRQSLPPIDQYEGQTVPTRGANNNPTGGRACPRNVHNHPENRASRAPVLPCGQCDARPTDPISARIVWLDADRVRSALCPRCRPAAISPAGGAR